MDSDFDGMISWPRVREYLESELQLVRQKSDDAVGEEIYRLQGEARRLKRCLNLPAAVTLLQEDDKRGNDSLK